ncbi:DUF4376 domain-containing protein [Salmonella enterica subsp. enterica]|nr:DUF4376 domain-containing protein [Salmonella enterica subsp. enterica]EBF8607862.1 DUF4376 domain-containing protein [Salmonella enterica subsp. enterica]EBF8621886.1 DUF4376 domain-containing protein [Salmonella enterica subsp. enterica serovar Istanbul]EBH9104732.1 DUF4376 domain-containing protein [Salmonella enterica subsp. enterica]ECO6318116.1 DUF4376 domain-containing protein [Salmonella enterica subsp. enterica serovar Enteritidis]
MSATIIDVKEAAYNENGTISAKVLFGDADGKSPKYIPFTASETDSTAYGRQLFTDLKAGKYGPVTPFTVTPEMLAAAKEAKRAEINAWRDNQENGNYVFTLNGRNWDCSKASQDRLSPVTATAKSGTLPDGFFWTNADNEDIPMNADDLIVLEVAMQQHMVIVGFKIHERQRQMKEEVDALTDYTAVKSYAVGWAVTRG